jgi:hypothetical protein
MGFSSVHRWRLGRLNKQLDQAEVTDMETEGVQIGIESRKLIARLQISERFWMTEKSDFMQNQHTDTFGVKIVTEGPHRVIRGLER